MRMPRPVLALAAPVRRRLSGLDAAGHALPDLLPAQAKAQQVFAQAVGVIDGLALLARLGKKPPPRFRQARALSANGQHGGQLQAVKEVERGGFFRPQQAGGPVGGRWRAFGGAFRAAFGAAFRLLPRPEPAQAGGFGF